MEDSFQTDWWPNPPPGPNTMKQYAPDTDRYQLKGAFKPFFRDNIDTAVIDIAHDPIDQYKLVLLPAAYMMDKPTAQAIRWARCCSSTT